MTPKFMFLSAVLLFAFQGSDAAADAKLQKFDRSACAESEKNVCSSNQADQNLGSLVAIDDTLQRNDEELFLSLHSNEFWNDYRLDSLKKVFIKNSEIFCKLSDVEILAIAEYTSSGYKALNAYLRTEHKDSNDRVNKAFAKVLQRALHKLPAEPETVYRYDQMPSAVYSQHVEGALVTYKGFTSTSPGTWLSTDPMKTDCLVISQKSGRRIDVFSFMSNEREVLIPAGTKFKVLRKVENPNLKDRPSCKTEFFLQEVP